MLLTGGVKDEKCAGGEDIEPIELIRRDRTRAPQCTYTYPKAPNVIIPQSSMRKPQSFMRKPQSIARKPRVNPA